MRDTGQRDTMAAPKQRNGDADRPSSFRNPLPISVSSAT
jgi:hypothetical protein